MIRLKKVLEFLKILFRYLGGVRWKMMSYLENCSVK